MSLKKFILPLFCSVDGLVCQVFFNSLLMIDFFMQKNPDRVWILALILVSLTKTFILSHSLRLGPPSSLNSVTSTSKCWDQSLWSPVSLLTHSPRVSVPSGIPLFTFSSLPLYVMYLLCSPSFPPHCPLYYAYREHSLSQQGNPSGLNQTLSALKSKPFFFFTRVYNPLSTRA